MLSNNEREKLEKLCKLVRYNILTSTSQARSGHPTSSLSAVELVVVLFFAEVLGKNDKFILSKGHASPLLYSIYQAAGVISRDELMTLRQFNSPLEGHPTPRLNLVDVATGSLGQGLSVGLGMALGFKLEARSAKREANSNLENSNLSSIVSDFDIRASDLRRVFVLLGDSEMAEGQIWEAMELASYYKLGNLVAILDVNRLGQRGETMLGWNLDTYAKRAEAFGWNVIVIDDGHDLEKVYNGYEKMAKWLNGQITNNLTVQQFKSSAPTMIIAKTIKGKGVSLWENKNGWHGKALNAEQLKQALNELGEVDLTLDARNLKLDLETRSSKLDNQTYNFNVQDPASKFQYPASYKIGSMIATREAYGDALVELGKNNPAIVALDAEVSNSTFSNKFAEKFPARFFEMFIAEQNMVSTALGISKTGFIPFVSTFSAFLTRTLDQIRMIELSLGNVKFCGSHAGVFIGQDGPSQMGLIDIAMFRSLLNSIVLYPTDAVSAFKLTGEMAKQEGIIYLRTNREKTPVIYSNSEEFRIGGSKILKQGKNDKTVVFAAGVTVHEALKAYENLQKEGVSIAIVDLYSVKPLDNLTVQQFSHLPMVVAEDHYPVGGLGEAVLTGLLGKGKEATQQLNELPNLNPNFIHLCVRKTPRSGKPEELLKFEEIDANAIIKAVKNLLL